MKTYSELLHCAAAIVLMLSALPAGGQQYPSRSLRIVVPFAPGGSLDTLARVVGQPLAERLGQPVVIDNRPGGGGIVGTDIVAKAQPDGHTLVLGTVSTMAMAPALRAKLPYDPMRDFEHIGLWVTFPLVLVVPASSPLNGLQDLIAQAKAKPGSLRFASQGVGSSAHIFVELMNSMARMKVIHVPYKGGGPALTGVLAGEVDYGMIAVATALAQVKNGKVRPLGVSSAQPSASLPNVPPIASALPGYEALNFHGLDAPARTPRAIVRKLNEESTKILNRSDVQERLKALSMDIVPSSPEAYRAFVKAQIALWGPLVKSSGARVD